MKKFQPICAFVMVAFLFASCKKNNESQTSQKSQTQNITQTCPTDSDEITFDAVTCYYGTWKLGDEGGGGYGAGYDGKFNLQLSCGWLIFNGNSGQTGRPYEVYLPPDTAVMFGWVGGFTEIDVNHKWKGSINGIKIGDSVSKFIQAFPQSVEVNIDHPYFTVYTYTIPSEQLVQIEFDFYFTYPYGKLTKIGIGL